jgi:hypothetical protein
MCELSCGFGLEMLYRSLELEKDQKSYKVYNDGRTFRTIARVRHWGRVARSRVRDFGKKDSDVAVQRLSNLLGCCNLTLFDYGSAVAYRPFGIRKAYRTSVIEYLCRIDTMWNSSDGMTKLEPGYYFRQVLQSNVLRHPVVQEIGYGAIS